MKLSEQIRELALEYGSGEIGNCALDKTNKGVEAINRIIKLAEAHEAEYVWRTIESAPKDETKILIFGDCGIVVVAYMWGQWRDIVSCLALRNAPTHWMPLPNPPQEGGAS